MSTYTIDELNEPIEYVTTDGVHHYLIPVSQRNAVEFTQESDPVEYQKDVNGVTDPNLHRRVFENEDPQPEEIEPEIAFMVRDKNSYRTTYYNTHDEDSETEEIP